VASHAINEMIVALIFLAPHRRRIEHDRRVAAAGKHLRRKLMGRMKLAGMPARNNDRWKWTLSNRQEQRCTRLPAVDRLVDDVFDHIRLALVPRYGFCIERRG